VAAGDALVVIRRADGLLEDVAAGGDVGAGWAF
jgi:hypothetical protein